MILKKQGMVRNHTNNFLLLLTVGGILILAIHTLHIAKIPVGFFLDETSIGYNAISILRTGADEHGIRFPIFFESVGDYKNPIYIYMVSLVFKVFGASEISLRATSIFFYSIAMGATVILASKIFQKNNVVLVYVLLSFGFLPIFFIISRLSFEVITQLTWVTIQTLCIWLIFNNAKSTTHATLKLSFCGLVMGTSIYTYTTGRFLSVFALFILWVVYFNRENLRRLLIISSAFSVSLIPFLYFTLTNKGVVTSRFFELSFIDDPISILEKGRLFIHNLGVYWSLDFLILHGDSNLRHSTGNCGIIYWIVLLLFIIGIVNIVIHKKINRFTIFLFLNLLVSPMAAALTSEGTPHALRSMLLGYYILLLSLYGMELITSAGNLRLRQIAIACAFIILFVEAARYELDYFLAYPARSVEAMGSFDFKTLLQTAIDQDPTEVIYINEPRITYANLQFYETLAENPNGIPITMTDHPNPEPGSCVLYNRRNEWMLEAVTIPYNEFKSQYTAGLSVLLLPQNTFDGVMKVRCYQQPE